MSIDYGYTFSHIANSLHASTKDLVSSPWKKVAKIYLRSVVLDSINFINNMSFG